MNQTERELQRELLARYRRNGWCWTAQQEVRDGHLAVDTITYCHTHHQPFVKCKKDGDET